MILTKPSHTLLPNQVQFIVSPQMTKLDVKQYLEKIYNVPIVNVNTHIKMGEYFTKWFASQKLWELTSTSQNFLEL